MENWITLDLVPFGNKAQVRSIRAEGAMRRRLMDLGFTPGAETTPILSAAAGDPRAYSIRGTVIALRNATAKEITVFPAWEGT